MFEALKIAAQEDQSLRLGELALQLPTEGPLEAGYKEKLRDIARRASDGTIYSEGLTAAAIPVLAGPAGFHGDEGLEQFGSLFPIAIRSAEVAQQRHLGGLDDTLKANVGYAHMLGTYSGQPAIDSLNQLQAIGASVGKTPAEEEKILGYSVPIGKALGGNVEDIADVTGFIQRQGLNSTTAGTGLAALMLQLTHAETLDAHDTHARARRRSAESEFASAMHLTPQAVHQLRSTNRESKKVEALEDIGLLDHQGHLADRLPTGGIDIVGVSRRINAFATQYPDRWARDSQSLDTRALRSAAMLSDQTPGMGLAEYQTYRRSTPSAEVQQAALADSPLQRFEQVVARFNDILNTIATGTLSTFDGALKGAITGLTDVNHYLQHHDEAAAGTALTAGGALGSQVLRGAGGWLTKRGMTGIGGRLTGLAELGPLGEVAGLSMIANDAITSLFDAGQDAIFGKGSAARFHAQEASLQNAGGGLLPNILHLFGGEPAHAQAAPRSLSQDRPHHAIAGVSITSPLSSLAAGGAVSAAPVNSNNTTTATITNNITVNAPAGVDAHSMGATILGTIASGLRNILTHSSGAGEGITSAPGTVGAHP